MPTPKGEKAIVAILNGNSSYFDGKELHQKWLH
jgi:hypothetical protein